MDKPTPRGEWTQIIDEAANRIDNMHPDRWPTEDEIKPFIRQAINAALADLNSQVDTAQHNYIHRLNELQQELEEARELIKVYGGRQDKVACETFDAFLNKTRGKP